MSVAVGFVGVLRRAGPRRSKRIQVDACVGRLVLRERSIILGSGTSGDIVRTKNCGRRFDRKAMMHGPCIFIYPGPREICYSTQKYSLRSQILAFLAISTSDYIRSKMSESTL